MPKERRAALASLIFLLSVLSVLVLHNRVPGERAQLQAGAGTSNHTADAVPTVQVQPKVTMPVETTTPAPVHLQQPLAGEHRLLQGFAVYYSDVFQDFRMNPGLDWAATPGEHVRAAGPGRVVSIETNHPVDGVVVTLDHGGGLTTRYASLTQVVVTLQAMVAQGDTLGLVGAPEPSRLKLGTHLHVETLLNGQPVDPSSFFLH
jgi:murein DD-endopeptidase MepM/ murein hydrolase activator NlpD